MGTLATITRRAFLVGSAAIVGGVAFGYYEYQKDPANPLKSDENQTALNPYLLITKDDIIIITPRAEMGQGVHTTLAALVAEELDISWQSIKTQHGPPSKAYYNAPAATVPPVADYQDSTTKEAFTSAMEVMAKLMGLQITGTSATIKDGYDKMRLAGATARQVLIEAAARRSGHPASALKTKDGAVILPDGSKLPYHDLAQDAQTITPPEQVQLKDPSQWRYLGKNMPRVDMVAKVTGTTPFSIDTKLDGMLFATVRMNPHLGAKMESFDDKKAKALPAVKKIVDLGNGVGVIASNTWAAFQAAKALSINWQKAPYPDNSQKIFAHIEKAFQDSANSTLRDEGDVNTALQETKNLIKADYKAPFLAHATMEPMNATALFKDGHLTVWAGTQAPMAARETAAKTANVTIEDVTLHTTYMGGGFGRRLDVDFIAQAVKLAVSIPGTPIKLTWSREEDMRHDFYRPAALARFQGVMSDKKPTAIKADIAAPSLYRQMMQRVAGMTPPGPDRLLVEGSFDQPYGIENYQVNGHISDLAIPLGSWRSVGNSYNSFFHESFLDELAAAKGLDPLQMRLDLMKEEHKPSYKVLEAVAQMANWQTPLGEGKGRGVAFCHSFGTPVAEIIEISNKEEGIKIDKVYCAIDVGIALDPRNIEAQMISGIIYGLSAAVMGEITFKDGQVEQANFDSYDALRMATAPEIEVKILQNDTHINGVGEPATPPSLPALANAIFNLTGKRIRTLPLRHEIEFL